jgi:glycerol-3-phosphate dehydrogenase
MRRQPRQLAAGRFDLLVIGGGICGAWTAYEAALRGLRVALVEREDWAAGTSSASSKLIHGGLRYLEHGDIGLVACSLRERARLMALAPHRVHGLRFLLPIFPDSRMGRLGLVAGLTLYDRLSGAHAARAGLAPHRYLEAGLLAAQAPYLAQGLRGGFTYADAGSDDARFTLEIVAGAVAAGVVAVNHASVDHLLRTRAGAVSGALVVDQLLDRAYEVVASQTVNAAGAWAGALTGRSPRVRLSKGVHLVMPPLPGADPAGATALLLTAASDRRVFFLIPWYGATLLGTTDSEFHGDPAALTVTPAERDYLLAEANRRCPALGWHAGLVRGSYAGVRVLQAQGGRGIGATTREWRLDHPAPGLLVPVGGKFTSARVEANRIVDQVAAALGRQPQHSVGATRPFPWRPPGPWSCFLPAAVAAGIAAGLDAEVARTAACRYGRRVGALHERLRAQPGLGARIAPTLPFCQGEIGLAVAEEMAISDADVLRRRIPVAILAQLSGREQRRVDELLAAARLAVAENPT